MTGYAFGPKFNILSLFKAAGSRLDIRWDRNTGYSVKSK